MQLIYLQTRGEKWRLQIKTVLVTFEAFNRLVEVVCRIDAPLTEKDLLICEIRKTFSDRIPVDSRLTLQQKNESWGGAFIDYFGDVIEDKSVFKVLVDRPIPTQVRI